LIYSSKNDKSIPFDLFIGTSRTRQSMSIEFSSKILLDDYPKLISKDTFPKCLENIHQLGICELDIDSILQYCYFKTLHVTKDISLELTDPVLDTLNSSVNNYRRFNWNHYEKEGITFTKDVKSVGCKESITIYNKAKEMATSKNQKFLSMLNDPDKILQYFNGKTRIETILKGNDRIKHYLGIPDTHINNVFSSTENSVLYQFNQVFGYDASPEQVNIANTEEYLLKNTLLLHNHDLKRIEQDLRKCYTSRGALTNRMKKIKQLSFEMQQASKNNSTILDDIRNKLDNHTIYSIIE